MTFSLKISAGALALLACAFAQTSPSSQTEQALERFDEIKFGMFIHWGLYAIPAGEWNGHYVRGIGEWIMFREKIPVKQYEQLAAKFNPVKFSADEWTQLARDAGMRYMVITSKHHDGFAMFGSKVSKYNIVDATPYGKDPIKALSVAAAKRDLIFGMYYSQDQDWHEPDGRGNTWDFPAERNSERYLNGKVIPQVKEILTGYGKLGLIWFDTPGMLSEQQVIDLRNTVKTLQPTCLLNSRIGHNQGDYFQTGDNAIPIQVYSKRKWEVPATLNDTWGYKKDDHHWKDPGDLIAKLADIVSKGGNYLLNVGPTAEGVIPEESQRILRTVGKWVAANGESIYGTSASPFYFPDITWRCTVKPNRVYLHILNWPGATFRFEGLESDVKRAWFLENKKPVPFKRDGAVLTFNLPAQPLDAYDTVIALEIVDRVPRVAPGFEAHHLPARLDLYAWTGRLNGEDLRYDKPTASVSNFRHATGSSTNQVQWYNYEALDGEYEVEITYACDDAAAGSDFKLGALTGKIEGTAGQFVTKKIGSLQIHSGDQSISFSLPNDDKSSGLRLKKLTLTKKS